MEETFSPPCPEPDAPLIALSGGGEPGVCACSAASCMTHHPIAAQSAPSALPDRVFRPAASRFPTLSLLPERSTGMYYYWQIGVIQAIREHMPLDTVHFVRPYLASSMLPVVELSLLLSTPIRSTDRSPPVFALINRKQHQHRSTVTSTIAPAIARLTCRALSVDAYATRRAACLPAPSPLSSPPATSTSWCDRPTRHHAPPRATTRHHAPFTSVKRLSLAPTLPLRPVNSCTHFSSVTTPGPASPPPPLPFSLLSAVSALPPFHHSTYPTIRVSACPRVRCRSPSSSPTRSPSAPTPSARSKASPAFGAQ